MPSVTLSKRKNPKKLNDEELSQQIALNIREYHEHDVQQEIRLTNIGSRIDPDKRFKSFYNHRKEQWHQLGLDKTPELSERSWRSHPDKVLPHELARLYTQELSVTEGSNVEAQQVSDVGVEEIPKSVEEPPKTKKAQVQRFSSSSELMSSEPSTPRLPIPSTPEEFQNEKLFRFFHQQQTSSSASSVSSKPKNDANRFNTKEEEDNTDDDDISETQFSQWSRASVERRSSMDSRSNFFSFQNQSKPISEGTKIERNEENRRRRAYEQLVGSSIMQMFHSNDDNDSYNVTENDFQSADMPNKIHDNFQNETHHRMEDTATTPVFGRSPSASCSSMKGVESSNSFAIINSLDEQNMSVEINSMKGDKALRWRRFASPIPKRSVPIRQETVLPEVKTSPFLFVGENDEEQLNISEDITSSVKIPIIENNKSASSLEEIFETEAEGEQADTLEEIEKALNELRKKEKEKEELEEEIAEELEKQGEKFPDRVDETVSERKERRKERKRSRRSKERKERSSRDKDREKKKKSSKKEKKENSTFSPERNENNEPDGIRRKTIEEGHDGNPLQHMSSSDDDIKKQDKSKKKHRKYHHHKDRKEDKDKDDQKDHEEKETTDKKKHRSKSSRRASRKSMDSIADPVVTLIEDDKEEEQVPINPIDPDAIPPHISPSNSVSFHENPVEVQLVASTQDVNQQIEESIKQIENHSEAVNDSETAIKNTEENEKEDEDTSTSNPLRNAKKESDNNGTMLNQLKHELSAEMRSLIQPLVLKLENQETILQEQNMRRDFEKEEQNMNKNFNNLPFNLPTPKAKEIQKRFAQLLFGHQKLEQKQTPTIIPQIPINENAQNILHKKSATMVNHDESSDEQNNINDIAIQRKQLPEKMNDKNDEEHNLEQRQVLSDDMTTEDLLNEIRNRRPTPFIQMAFLRIFRLRTEDAADVTSALQKMLCSEQSRIAASVTILEDEQNPNRIHGSPIGTEEERRLLKAEQRFVIGASKRNFRNGSSAMRLRGGVELLTSKLDALQSLATVLQKKGLFLDDPLLVQAKGWQISMPGIFGEVQVFLASAASTCVSVRNFCFHDMSQLSKITRPVLEELREKIRSAMDLIEAGIYPDGSSFLERSAVRFSNLYPNGVGNEDEYYRQHGRVARAHVWGQIAQESGMKERHLEQEEVAGLNAKEIGILENRTRKILIDIDGGLRMALKHLDSECEPDFSKMSRILAVALDRTRVCGAHIESARYEIPQYIRNRLAKVPVGRDQFNNSGVPTSIIEKEQNADEFKRLPKMDPYQTAKVNERIRQRAASMPMDKRLHAIRDVNQHRSHKQINFDADAAADASYFATVNPERDEDTIFMQSLDAAAPEIDKLGSYQRWITEKTENTYNAEEDVVYQHRKQKEHEHHRDDHHHKHHGSDMIKSNEHQNHEEEHQHHKHHHHHHDDPNANEDPSAPFLHYAPTYAEIAEAVYWHDQGHTPLARDVMRVPTAFSLAPGYQMTSGARFGGAGNGPGIGGSYVEYKTTAQQNTNQDVLSFDNDFTYGQPVPMMTSPIEFTEQEYSRLIKENEERNFSSSLQHEQSSRPSMIPDVGFSPSHPQNPRLELLLTLFFEMEKLFGETQMKVLAQRDGRGINQFADENDRNNIDDIDVDLQNLKEVQEEVKRDHKRIEIERKKKFEQNNENDLEDIVDAAGSAFGWAGSMLGIVEDEEGQKKLQRDFAKKKALKELTIVENAAKNEIGRLSKVDKLLERICNDLDQLCSILSRFMKGFAEAKGLPYEDEDGQLIKPHGRLLTKLDDPGQIMNYKKESEFDEFYKFLDNDPGEINEIAINEDGSPSKGGIPFEVKSLSKQRHINRKKGIDRPFYGSPTASNFLQPSPPPTPTPPPSTPPEDPEPVEPEVPELTPEQIAELERQAAELEQQAKIAAKREAVLGSPSESGDEWQEVIKRQDMLEICDKIPWLQPLRKEDGSIHVFNAESCRRVTADVASVWSFFEAVSREEIDLEGEFFENEEYDEMGFRKEKEMMNMTETENMKKVEPIDDSIEARRARLMAKLDVADILIARLARSHRFKSVAQAEMLVSTVAAIIARKWELLPPEDESLWYRGVDISGKPLQSIDPRGKSETQEVPPPPPLDGAKIMHVEDIRRSSIIEGEEKPKIIPTEILKDDVAPLYLPFVADQTLKKMKQNIEGGADWFAEEEESAIHPLDEHIARVRKVANANYERIRLRKLLNKYTPPVEDTAELWNKMYKGRAGKSPLRTESGIRSGPYERGGLNSGRLIGGGGVVRDHSIYMGKDGILKENPQARRKTGALDLERISAQTNSKDRENLKTITTTTQSIQDDFEEKVYLESHRISIQDSTSQTRKTRTKETESQTQTVPERLTMSVRETKIHQSFALRARTLDNMFERMLNETHKNNIETDQENMILFPSPAEEVEILESKLRWGIHGPTYSKRPPKTKLPMHFIDSRDPSFSILETSENQRLISNNDLSSGSAQTNSSIFNDSNHKEYEERNTEDVNYVTINDQEKNIAPNDVWPTTSKKDLEEDEISLKRKELSEDIESLQQDIINVRRSSINSASGSSSFSSVNKGSHGSFGGSLVDEKISATSKSSSQGSRRSSDSIDPSSVPRMSFI